MANPDIANPSVQVFGRTELQKIATTATAIVTNAADSGKVFKINALVVANVVAADVAVTVDILRDGVSFRLINQVAVPSKSSIVLAAKENPFYLQEGDALRLQASLANAAEALCSFEEFST
jgi:hypothetical protein